MTKTYVLLGHDHNGVFNGSVSTWEQEPRDPNLVLIRPEPGKSMQDSIREYVTEPGNVIVACHGSTDGSVMWHDGNTVPYARVFESLPKDGAINEVMVMSCYGGTSMDMLHDLPPGTLLFSSVGKETVAIGGDFTSAETEIRERSSQTRVGDFLERLDNVSADYIAENFEKYNNSTNPNDVLPHIIGVGGNPPTEINLNEKIRELNGVDTKYSTAYQRAITMVQDHFDGRHVINPEESNEEREANVDAEVLRVSEKIRTGQALEGPNELRIGYAIAAAYMETSGELDRIITTSRNPEPVQVRSFSEKADAIGVRRFELEGTVNEADIDALDQERLRRGGSITIKFNGASLGVNNRETLERVVEAHNAAVTAPAEPTPPRAEPPVAEIPGQVRLGNNEYITRETAHKLVREWELNGGELTVVMDGRRRRMDGIGDISSFVDEQNRKPGVTPPDGQAVDGRAVNEIWHSGAWRADSLEAFAQRQQNAAEAANQAREESARRDQERQSRAAAENERKNMPNAYLAANGYDADRLLASRDGAYSSNENVLNHARRNVEGLMGRGEASVSNTGTFESIEWGATTNRQERLNTLLERNKEKMEIHAETLVARTPADLTDENLTGISGEQRKGLQDKYSAMTMDQLLGTQVQMQFSVRDSNTGQTRTETRTATVEQYLEHVDRLSPEQKYAFQRGLVAQGLAAQNEQGVIFSPVDNLVRDQHRTRELQMERAALLEHAANNRLAVNEQDRNPNIEALSNKTMNRANIRSAMREGSEESQQIELSQAAAMHNGKTAIESFKQDKAEHPEWKFELSQRLESEIERSRIHTKEEAQARYGGMDAFQVRTELLKMEAEYITIATSGVDQRFLGDIRGSYIREINALREARPELTIPQPGTAEFSAFQSQSRTQMTEYQTQRDSFFSTVMNAEKLDSFKTEHLSPETRAGIINMVPEQFRGAIGQELNAKLYDMAVEELKAGNVAAAQNLVLSLPKILRDEAIDAMRQRPDIKNDSTINNNLTRLEAGVATIQSPGSSTITLQTTTAEERNFSFNARPAGDMSRDAAAARVA